MRDTLAIVTLGQEAGEIRNVVYQDVRGVINRMVQYQWEKQINDQYFFGGREEQHPQAVRDLFWECNPQSSHDLFSVHRKLARTSASGRAVDAMRSLTDELLPLAVAVRDLKNKVVMGRVLREEPAPVNPEKIVKTCACCKRGIAVTDKGLMAHHGYRRTELGLQTQSCMGIKYAPLEVSDEGLRAITKATNNWLQNREKMLAGLPTRAQITIPEGPVRSRKWTQITRDDPRWHQAYTNLKNELAAEVCRGAAQLKQLQMQLAAWQPQVPMDPRLVPIYGRGYVPPPDAPLIRGRDTTGDSAVGPPAGHEQETGDGEPPQGPPCSESYADTLARPRA